MVRGSDAGVQEVGRLPFCLGYGAAGVHQTDEFSLLLSERAKRTCYPCVQYNLP